MVLGSLKRGVEPGARLDVRTFGVPENAPQAREKFKLPEEELDFILAQRAKEIPSLDIPIMGNLIYLFPEHAVRIATDADTKEETLNNITGSSFASVFLELAEAYKLINPKMDVAAIVRRQISPEELYERFVLGNFKEKNIGEAILFLAKIKFIFPDFSIAALIDRWEEVEKELVMAKRAEDWYYFGELTRALRLLFPEQTKKISYQQHWPELLAELETRKHVTRETRLNLEDIVKYCRFAFDLTVLDADEVKIDETGLHLINHPAPEGLGEDVPEQPVGREI